MPNPGAITIGIVAAVLSSFVQSLGLTLQRKSHVIEDARTRRRRVWRRPLWRIGLGIFILANIFGSSIQITTLPIVLLAPLQASGLIFNTILAAIMLHEPFTLSSFLGAILAATGAILIAAFGAIDEPTHTLDQLLALFSRTPFLIWAAIQTLLLFVLVFFAVIIARKSRTSALHKLIHGLILGSVSGILSAHMLLLAKTAVELIVRTVVQGDNQFTRYPAWLIPIAVILLACIQLYCLNSGLRSCSTSILYPLVFCIYNITSILNGLIYYDQAARLKVQQIALVAIGTVILLVGVALLSWRLTFAHPSAPSEDETSLLATDIAQNARQATVYQVTTPALDVFFGQIEAQIAAAQQREREQQQQELQKKQRLKHTSKPPPPPKLVTRLSWGHSPVGARRVSLHRPISALEAGMVWDELDEEEWDDDTLPLLASDVVENSGQLAMQ